MRLPSEREISLREKEVEYSYCNGNFHPEFELRGGKGKLVMVYMRPCACGCERKVCDEKGTNRFTENHSILGRAEVRIMIFLRLGNYTCAATILYENFGESNVLSFPPAHRPTAATLFVSEFLLAFFSHCGRSTAATTSTHHHLQFSFSHTTEG